MAVRDVMPDLVASSLTWTGQPTAGQALGLVWAVTNTGRMAVNPTWYDAVYFSTNATLDATATRLRQVARSQTLAAGAGYQLNNSVTIPANAPPGYYLILKTDDQNSVYEANEPNNILVVSALPTLTITRTNQIIQISWPTWASGYGLETAQRAALGSWLAVTNAPTILAGQKVLTIAPTNVTQFYRLRKP